MDEEADTIAQFDENIEVDVDESEDTQTATIEVGDKTVKVAVHESGTMEGSVEYSDANGNPTSSTIKVDKSKSTTTVDDQGNIDTMVKTESDSTVKISINVDGSVKHEVQTPQGVSIAISSIGASDVEVDNQGNITTTSTLEKNGFIYKGVVSTSSKGESQTKFIKIDVATGKEVEVKNTLNSTTPYDSGSYTEIMELDDVIYIKTSTPINSGFVIE